MCRSSDIAAINSVKISSYERIINSSIPSQESSVITVLKTEKMIREVFAVFDNLQIGYFEYKWLNILSSHWMIYGEKND